MWNVVSRSKAMSYISCALAYEIRVNDLKLYQGRSV